MAKTFRICFKKKSFKTELNIQLSKFKLEQRMELKATLMALGISDMFSTGLADFSISGITSYIFYIRDKLTGMLLFQGRVVNPKV